MIKRSSTFQNSRITKRNRYIYIIPSSNDRDCILCSVFRIPALFFLLLIVFEIKQLQDGLLVLLETLFVLPPLHDELYVHDVLGLPRGVQGTLPLPELVVIVDHVGFRLRGLPTFNLETDNERKQA